VVCGVDDQPPKPPAGWLPRDGAAALEPKLKIDISRLLSCNNTNTQIKVIVRCDMNLIGNVILNGSPPISNAQGKSSLDSPEVISLHFSRKY